MLHINTSVLVGDRLRQLLRYHAFCVLFWRLRSFGGISFNKINSIVNPWWADKYFFKRKKTFALRMMMFDGTQENKERHQNTLFFLVSYVHWWRRNPEQFSPHGWSQNVINGTGKVHSQETVKIAALRSFFCFRRVHF